jgi:hypothetical protein
MAQWGRNDKSVTANSSTTVESSNGAPIGTWALVKAGGQNTSVRTDGANAHFGNTSPMSRANVDVAMFGNTTQDAFVPGVAKGIFGVDAAETNVLGGIAKTYVTSGGTGYGSAPVVTVTFANGSSNASYVNSSITLGKVTALTVNISSSGIVGGNPSVSIAAPAAISITANSTGFSNTTDTIAITSANSRLQVGDRLYYAVPAGNTAIAPLTANDYYYVSFANTSRIALSLTAGGANIDITDARTTASGESHTLTGNTAAGYVVLGGGDTQGVTHAGWVLRTEGSGGRAGRVHYETLVAMGSLGAQTAPYGTAATTADASDDTFLPDS